MGRARHNKSEKTPHYMHPAIMSLAGDVAGHRILDVGCGSGPIAAKLRDRGATVTGLDSSPDSPAGKPAGAPFVSRIN